MSRKLQLVEVRTLVRDVLLTHRRELDCDGCLRQLHIFAELTLTYQNPARVMPEVAHHLEECFCCREEFEFLLVVLRCGE